MKKWAQQKDGNDYIFSDVFYLIGLYPDEFLLIYILSLP